MKEQAPLLLSMRAVRRLAVAKQHLEGRPPRPRGPAAILDLMKDMRHVQLDSSTTVAPSHLIVLWSRLGKFKEADFDRLLWKDKKLLEGWAHEASVFPTQDFPLLACKGKMYANGRLAWERRAIEDLASFLGAKEVTLTGKVPEVWRSYLR